VFAIPAVSRVKLGGQEVRLAERVRKPNFIPGFVRETGSLRPREIPQGELPLPVQAQFQPGRRFRRQPRGATRAPIGLTQPRNPGVATPGRCPIPSPRESGERARERGRCALSRGRAPLPPRFARRPLPASRGEANSPDARKLSIPPNIQTVRCSSACAE
jgi:hypothetical protein